jgi:hypothetical protein
MPQARVLSDQVHWVADDQTAQQQADTIIIAIPPEHQPGMAQTVLALPNINRLVLEKPLAPTPATALELLDDLEDSGKEFRIAYIFRFTDWGRNFYRKRPRTSLRLSGALWLITLSISSTIGDEMEQPAVGRFGFMASISLLCWLKWATPR